MKLFLLISGVLLFPLAASGRSGVPGTPLPRQSEYAIRFKDQLRLAGDLTLTANVTSTSITFRCESRWKPSRPSRLHLFIGHSPNLDGNRSFLSISLNYGILRSLRLDAQNERTTEVVILLPPDLLKLENELLFSVEQFPAPNASPSGLRTTIGAQSAIVIHSDEEHPVLDLALLPSPLIDPYSYRPKKLAVLLPHLPSLETLEATALLVANFCARVSPEPVSIEIVRTVSAAQDPLLVAGTPGEQPGVGTLGGSSMLIQGGTGEPGISLAGGDKLADSEGVAGLAMMKAGLRSNPILFLTGSSPGGVLQAARTLVSPGFRVSGSFARITPNRPKAAEPARAWPGFIPPTNRFTLSDLNYRELKILPRDDFTLTVPLRAAPDVQFLSYGHEMELFFKLNPNLEVENCQMKVVLNEVTLGTFALREIAKGTLVSMRLQVPARLLGTANNLRIVVLGAATKAWRDPAAWLLPHSQFYFPRVYAVELPNLALLQHHLYPFSLKADLSETIILLPNQFSAGLSAAVLELSSALGRLAPARHLDFRLRRVHDLRGAEKGSFHFISLHTAGPEDAPESVFPGWKSPPRARTPKGLTVIQEAPSPWNARRYVLSITAASLTGLQRAVRQAFHQTTLNQLGGDAAVLGNEVVCFDLAPKRKVRETSYLTYVQAWLRMNWLALPVILTAASGLLFIVLRLTLKYRKEK